MSEQQLSEQVRVRRAPRLWVFLLLGAIVGAIVTLIVTSLADTDPTVGFAATYGYFCLYGVSAGFVLGAAVGLLLDRRSTRRARTVTAELARVADPAPAAPDSPTAADPPRAAADPTRAPADPPRAAADPPRAPAAPDA